MTDLQNEIAAVKAALNTDWDDERALLAEEKFVGRYRRRKTLRRVGGTMITLALIAAAAASVHFWNRHNTMPAPVMTADQTHPGLIRLSDGSTAEVMTAESQLTLLSSAETRVVFGIEKGGARFAVSKNPARVFRVEAGKVVVEVLGTHFSVEHSRADGRVRVAVEEGRVRVLWDSGQRELMTSEAGLFPPDSAGQEANVEPADNNTTANAAAVEKPVAAAKTLAKSSHHSSSWQALAGQGEYQKAYDVLASEEVQVSDLPAELLLAADVKRLSHHPAEAVAPLRKILDEHEGDPRAPLAAFTLGRLLLEELSQPADAALAFARAESLAPNGALAQDALAREVEAWASAGNVDSARRRAEEYLRQYPDGRKLKTVRRFGGIE